MTKQKLEVLCYPQTPEEVTQNLEGLLDLHSNDMGNPIEREVQALDASIKVIKFLLERR